MKAILTGLLFLSAALAGCVGPSPTSGPTGDPDDEPAHVRTFGDRDVAVPAGIPDAWGDATVVAVVDGGFNPYHWDWLAEKMPQHLDDDPSNDLPLDRPPHEWLPGYPDPSDFASFTTLNLTLEREDPDRDTGTLAQADAAEWSKLRRTTSPDEAHIAWIPGTKVIGLVNFQAGLSINSNAHGAKAASVAAGNLFGTCPECLVVFVNNAGENGMNWVMQQPWIDAVTNSYGFSLVNRDRLYSGSDILAQREASERGQTILFSAGNGQLNTFTAPNPTLFSSQEGPDWIVTVGAVSPQKRASYTGHGKPADIASLGSQYPSQGGTSTTGEGTFGGTSSATPTITGTYARGLWLARTLMEGPSRTQADGVVAVGQGVACGAEFPECELGDGVLTAKELRMRLYHGAIHTPAGMVVGTLGEDVEIPTTDEVEFLNEGHGTYFGRMDGDEAWMAEFARFVGPLTGEAAPMERPAGEREWMVVLSYCRQQIWDLTWRDGYWVTGQTPLPGPSPLWPTRSALEASCPLLFPPV